MCLMYFINHNSLVVSVLSKMGFSISEIQIYVFAVL